MWNGSSTPVFAGRGRGFPKILMQNNNNLNGDMQQSRSGYNSSTSISGGRGRGLLSSITSSRFSQSPPVLYPANQTPSPSHSTSAYITVDSDLKIELLKKEMAEQQMKHERELAEIESQREIQRHLEAQRQRDHELELAKLRSLESKNTSYQWKCESFPTFDEDKDKIVSYFESFERRAKLANDDRKIWITWLGQVFCKGKVSEVYARAVKDPNATYDDVKAALLSHFNLTPEEYRRKFRALKPEIDEMPKQFAKRLQRHFDQWLESENVHDLQKLKDVIVIEQMMKVYSNEERIHVRQTNSTSSLEKVVESLQLYASARIYQKGKQRATQKEDATGNNNDDNKQNKENQEKEAIPTEKPQCNVCHRKSHWTKDCWFKPGACAIKKRKPLNLEKENVFHTINTVSNTGLPVINGSVEGKRCEVLRDTGSGCVVVQKDLVPKKCMKKKVQKIIMIDGQEKEFPTARVNVKSSYLSGVVDVVVMDSPLFPCIIGNVEGAADPKLEKNQIKFENDSKYQKKQSTKSFEKNKHYQRYNQTEENFLDKQNHGCQGWRQQPPVQTGCQGQKKLPVPQKFLEDNNTIVPEPNKTMLDVQEKNINTSESNLETRNDKTKMVVRPDKNQEQRKNKYDNVDISVEEQTKDEINKAIGEEQNTLKEKITSQKESNKSTNVIDSEVKHDLHIIKSNDDYISTKKEEQTMDVNKDKQTEKDTTTSCDHDIISNLDLTNSKQNLKTIIKQPNNDGIENIQLINDQSDVNDGKQNVLQLTNNNNDNAIEKYSTKENNEKEESTKMREKEKDENGVPACATTRSQTKTKEVTPSVKPLKTIESVCFTKRSDIIEAQQNDASLKKCRENVANETILDHKYGQSKFFTSNGLMMRSYEEYDAPGHFYQQIVLPENVRKNVLKLAHEGLLSGHLSMEKTFNRIIPHFYWPGMRADVKRFCQSCDSCQRTISKGKVPKVPLGNVPIVGEPFYRVAVDLVGPLERTTSGKKYILTLVDYATRYPECIALPNITAETVAEALLSIFCRCGIPKIIHSDRGSQFTSQMMAEVCRLLNVKQSFTTAWHPQANGLNERMNSTLKNMLRRMCAEKPKDWDRYLNPILFAYREVPNASTQFSPFELLYGRSIRGPMAILRESMEEDEIPEEVKTSYEYVFDLQNRLEETCKAAAENLETSKVLYKKYFDTKTKDRQFVEGDEVLLLLPTEHSKLTMQWRGPFKVTQKVGDCDYRIQINNKEKIFHANMIKQYFRRQNEDKENEMKENHKEQSSNKMNMTACGLPAASAAVVHEENGDNIPTFNTDLGKEEKPTIDINPELDQDKVNEIQQFIDDFEDRYSKNPGRTDLETFTIELTDEKPIRSRPYHTPYAMREIIDQEIEKMMELGIIERSKSPYSSPVVLVLKKDQTYRFCIDYRKLNNITKFHAEPIPDQAHLFSKLQKAKYLSRIDLTKAFWQISIPEEDRPKTAFITHNGLYQWKVMPFGMVNSGATFSKMMSKLLENLPNVYHFMDDIIVGTGDWQSHMIALNELFTRLRVHNLTVKHEKCQFGYEKLEFLGHVIGKGEISTQPEKIQKVIDAEKPKNKKEMRSFLGLVGYYQKFVPNYASLAAPLTEALKKGTPASLIWSEDMNASYNKLKKAISSAPVLHLPDVKRPYVLRTDASDWGIGGILLQEHEGILFPVEYISRKLKPAERKYAVIERECLAVIWAIQKLQTYLYGIDFTIETDHNPLTFLNKAKLENARIMRWALQLQQYRFRVQSIKGSLNVGADYLSRCLPHE